MRLPLKPLVVVVPAYNESERIEAVVEEWAKTSSKLGGEVIVINDGSTDDTGSILDKISRRFKNVQIIHQKNVGHGPTILRGYREALNRSAEFVFQCDGDGEVSVREFEKFWKLRLNSDLILGVRGERESSWVRLKLSAQLAKFNQVLFGFTLKDANVPYRLFHRVLLQQVLEIVPKNSLIPNIQASIIATWFQSNVIEVPLDKKSLSRGSRSLTGSKLIKLCLQAAREISLLRLTLHKNIIFLRE